MSTLVDIGTRDHDGRPVAHIPAMGPDRDAADRALTSPILSVGGVRAGDYLSLRALQDAAQNLDDAGVSLSADILRALDVLDGVRTYAPDNAIPSISGMDRGQVLAALTDVVRTRSQKTVLPDARAAFVDAAHDELKRAMYDYIPAALDALRPRFDKAAKAYAAEHDVIAEHPDAGSAGLADESGKTVARWNRGRAAANEIVAVANLVIAMQGNGTTWTADSVRKGLFPALYASYIVSDRILVLADASPKPTLTEPLSAVQTIVTAGGSLSLPKDHAEWAERATTFTTLVDQARLEQYS